jgi:hypothetical protein
VTARAPAARRATQSGYALLAAMFVIVAFAGVSLIALTSMTISSSRISDGQRLSAREVRAADNALESAITRLRMDAAGELGSPEDCPAPTSFDSNGRAVTVSATCEESTQAMPDTPEAVATAPRVDLVGPDGYQAGTGFADTVRWANDCLRGDASLGSCAPWSLGIGTPNFNAHASGALGAARPSLVHTSALGSTGELTKGLLFASDVRARRGSATMIDPAEGRPAMRVAGRYEQADGGLFAAQGGGIACGIGTVGHPWNVVAAQVVDADDARGLPTCGAAATAAAALNPRAELAPRPTLDRTFNAFATVPACPAGDVVVLRPGAYGKVQTAALNRLLGGQCPNRTFWFQPASATAPGSYWFDVDDPTNPDGTPKPRDLWNSLVVSDPTVRVIFGTPTGGWSNAAAAAAAFPQACDPTGYGVEVILSPRTSIRHLAGKVAVCDQYDTASTSNVPPAIWQAGDADGGWSALPSTATSQVLPPARTNSGWLTNSSATVTNPQHAWRVDGQMARASFRCNITFSGSCAADVTLRGLGFGTQDVTTTPRHGQVRSLDLIVRAVAQNDSDFDLSLFSGGRSGTRIEVYQPGATTPTCAVAFPALPDSRSGGTIVNTLAYDLLSPQAESVGTTPRCRDVTFERADLPGLRVDVTYRLLKEVGFGFSYGDVHLDVDGMELRAGWDLWPTTTPAGSTFGSPEHLRATDAQHAGFTLSGCPVFGSCATDTRFGLAGGFDNPWSPHVPMGGPLLRAGVVVTGETTNQHFFTNGSFLDLAGSPDISNGSTIQVRVENLRDTPSGTSCTASWSRVPFWGQGLYLDLLDPAVSGTCATVLTSAEQLVGATARVQVYVQRNGPGLFVNYGTRIDSVRLSTVTAGDYTRPRAPMLLTYGAGPSADSTFHVFGQVSMPRNDLNVRWAGPPPVDGEGDPVPIGGGNMILSGLGSFVEPAGSAGIVCCSPTRPAERIVELVATVTRPDGSTRVGGTARVRISDVGGPGANVFIEDWSLS